MSEHTLNKNIKESELKGNSAEKAEVVMKPKKVYGPSRPPVDEQDKKSTSARNRSRSPPSDISRSGKDKRESWMTDIENTTSGQKLDPLNIKPRTFIQRRTDSHIIGPTPEVIDPSIRAKEKQMDEQIKEYNKVHRQETLQEIYAREQMGQKKAQTATDRQERIFDWERDMNSTVRQMSSKSAKDLVEKSTLKDRFGSSSSKKYL